MNISYSRVSSYLTCPYQHYLAYIKKISLNKPVKPLQFGSDFHKLLEYRIHPEELPKVMQDIGEVYYDMPPSWQTELGDNYVENLSLIFQDYQELYNDAPLPQKTEELFEIKIATCKGEDIIFKGVMDEVYKTKSKSTGKKTLKVADHKTFSRRPDSMFLVMNTQISLYSKACEFLWGRLPDKVIWDYICSSPAEEPIWLEKSGKFSTAKSQKITHFSYKRACKRQGITPDATLIDQYAGNIPNFFFKCELDIIPDMVDNVWEGFLYTAKDIALRGEKNQAKHISSMNCSFCQFKDLCYTELTGGDVSYILEKDYKQEE